jgi:hypothetical protein
MTRIQSLFTLLVIILAGFALRTHQLGAVSLRGDEGFSAQYWAALPLNQSLLEIATLEPHPPLTYALFRLWGISVGTSHEISLRLLPVLGNILGVAVMYALSLRLVPRQRWLALFSASLWAFHPYLLWHAQDFRNYAIWASLSAITLWLGLRLLGKHKQLDIYLYGLMSIVTPLFFYTELLSLGTLALIGLVIKRREPVFVQRWVLWHLIVVLLVGAVFLSLQGNLFNAGAYGGNTGGFSLSALWERFLPTFIVGDSFSTQLLTLLSAGSVLFLGIAWAIILRHKPSFALSLMGLILIPVALLSLVSMRVSIFNPRYILASMPAYLLSISLATFYIWHHSRLWRASLALLFVIWGIGIQIYFTNTVYLKAPDWRGLTQFLNQATHQNDFVIQTTVDAAFGYYFPYPERNKALPYTPQQSPEDILSILLPIAEQHQSIWLIGQSPADWMNRKVVPDWLESHWQLSQSLQVAGFKLNLYKPFAVLTEEIHYPQSISYYSALESSTVELRGFTLAPLSPEQQLTLWLYWRPDALIRPSHKVFVHLVGQINPATGSPLWTQADFLPQQGRISTETWKLNRLYRDPVTLDLNGVPAGTYEIRVGWYNPEDNRRLVLEDGTDYGVLTQVSITEDRDLGFMP